LPAPCIICGKTSDVVAEITAFGSPASIALCGGCELYYISNPPSQKFLDDFYARDYFSRVRRKRLHYFLKSWFSKLRSFSQSVYILNHRTKYGCTQSGGNSILEIGSADGTFLSLFKKKRWSVRGLEYNDFMIRKAYEKYAVTLERKTIFDLTQENETFDVIVFAHVLEHVTNPVETLIHARKLLKPGGFIFIELPHSPLPGEIETAELSEFITITHAAHIYNFRPRSLSGLVVKAGLVPVTVERFFYTVPPVSVTTQRLVGKTLMFGSLQTLNPPTNLDVFLTAVAMNSRFLSGNDPMRPIPVGAVWHGYGDNIRLIANAGG